jgi:hypothetical protein
MCWVSGSDIGNGIGNIIFAGWSRLWERYVCEERTLGSRRSSTCRKEELVLLCVT